MDVIILCGGEGTRLRSILPNVPKPMAPVLGKPFLQLLLDNLDRNGFSKIFLAVRYRGAQIIDYFSYFYKDLRLQYVIEDLPLGTGGAVKNALKECKSKNVMVLNGDTFFDINYKEFIQFHKQSKADISVAIKKYLDGDRYGSIEMGEDLKIKSFEEKTNTNMWMNGGAYILKRKIFEDWACTHFSLEKDFMPWALENKNVFGFPSQGYFIDIGVPDDFIKAQKELKRYYESYTSDRNQLQV